MKLKLCVEKRLNDYSCDYVKTIFIAFSLLYLILPYCLYNIVGDDFYIYSSYQSLTVFYSLVFFFLLWLVFGLLQKQVRKFETVNSIPPDRISFKIFFSIDSIYLLVIILRGIQFRLHGADRNYLLEMISSQLVPGYGYLLLLACISVIYLKERKYLFYFVGICFFIDLIYQGKIFTTNAVMVTMFYLDDLRIKISIKRLCYIGLVGFGFLFMIFAIRAVASGENVFVSVYSLFSEFMGVNATIGWGYEYFSSNQPPALLDFDFILREYYIDEVGHGLALSPVAYFIGNFGTTYPYFFSLFLYLGIIYILYFLSIKVLGRYALFVFMYNYIHLLRHGPDLFLFKSFLHTLFLVLVILLFNNYQEQKKGYSNYANRN